MKRRRGYDANQAVSRGAQNSRLCGALQASYIWMSFDERLPVFMPLLL